ncbi:MAG: hypothetical protein WA108_15405 [Thiobacillus sp.]|jgi:hypothetical protein
MNTAKELIQNLVRSQSEDATYDEIVRGLAFDRMVQRGLEDACKRRVVGNEDMLHRIKTWSNCDGRCWAETSMGRT